MRRYRFALVLSWTIFFAVGLLWGLDSTLLAARSSSTAETTLAPVIDDTLKSSTFFMAVPTTTLTTTTYLPLIHGNAPAPIVIAAAHIDSALSGEADEALLLWNTGMRSQSLAGWQIATASRRTTFPITSTLRLGPGEQVWCAAEAAIFRLSFGKEAACEWAVDSDPQSIDLMGKLTLANQGGRIQLYSATGALIDTLLYGDESTPAAGWFGPAAQIYARGDIPAVGQIWQRKLDPVTGSPLDTDRATDWSGDLGDLQWGRQVHMPGWQQLSIVPVVVANATMTVAVGPEGLYQPLANFIATTHKTLDLSLYTFEHKELAERVAAAAQRGVRVRLLLEGSPPGGISDLQKWSVMTIVAAGGEVRYLAVNERAPKGYRTRYRYLHAKYGISDGQRIFNGTENLTYDAMPVTNAEPSGGRRGFYLFVNARQAAERFEQLFTHDWASDRFADLVPYTPDHATYGAPPADFVFPELPLYPVDEAPFATAVAATGTATLAVISAPENATQPDQGLHALLTRAGAGDAIAVMELYEHKQWGDSTSHPVADPNPRLEMLLAAARRGAQIQVLLDSYFDDANALRNNRQTVDYLNQAAAAENLPLVAKLGNPTLAGIHAKLYLVRIGQERWSAVGSLNGGEVSHKLNREVVLLTDMAAIYQRLLEVFLWDWAR
ncbi:MAG TPA: phospholipase D-like domain-containing protein [Caldilineaceae bacterium]|nr:phospholipase D-like domain-containing protein [Caldilineaceae bacterium]